MNGYFEIVTRTGKKGDYDVIVLHFDNPNGGEFVIDLFIPYDKADTIRLIKSLRKEN